MIKTKRWVLAGVLLVMLAGALAGCGGPKLTKQKAMDEFEEMLEMFGSEADLEALNLKVTDIVMCKLSSSAKQMGIEQAALVEFEVEIEGEKDRNTFVYTYKDDDWALSIGMDDCP